VCSSLLLTTENLRPLALYAAFPHSAGQVVALLPTTTDAPSSGLIFRHYCHSVRVPFVAPHSDSDDPRLDIIQLLSI
jgi:hypothetical protein